MSARKKNHPTASADTVAVYCRVSSHEQRERQTIGTQTDFAARHCGAFGLRVHGYYLDDGVTGTVPLEQRPEGARLLRDARAGHFGTVLVFKVDRLARVARYILNAVADLEAAGVAVKSMTEPFDTSTSAGRFMLTMLSGAADLERENFLERSAEGTDRLAREGAWLGGIVPFGYRVEGRKKDARLVPSEEPIPGLNLSEADVIRMLYRLSADEGSSCYRLAERLNAMGVPPSYARDGRPVQRGKRKELTQGLWRPGRVRNMLVSPTYMGVHRYGTRSAKGREPIERRVPALVDEETWRKAQETLRRNMVMSPKNAKSRYLLRGVMKCGLCGLTYVGSSHTRADGSTGRYYRCNGKVAQRGPFGARGERCPSRSVQSFLEDAVWGDIEGFLRNPGGVVGELIAGREDGAGRTEAARARADDARLALAAKSKERDAVVALFRRGRIGDAALDVQLDQIEREEEALREEVLHSSAEADASARSEREALTAASVLEQIRARLDGEVSWETKRAIIEILVQGMRVHTVEEGGRAALRVVVRYRFPQPEEAETTLGTQSAAATRMDTDSWPRRVETPREKTTSARRGQW